MPPPTAAVCATGVSKTFRLPHERAQTLKERALHPRRGRRFDVLTALRDVSFEVERGECFGIVGRNGSGKSTLMKCLAGIYRADTGTMWLRGRMAPFIELGVGFNPELAAEDNVLLNAIMLGLTPAQARARYDDIIAFAELEEFVDLRLKNYSSGMQVRLAFSVMVHVDADVLLIDEVLAVGDVAFQQKCYDALALARSRGQTILLVSHDMDQVQRFCDRAMLLERGRVVALGDSGTVARRYNQMNFATRDERNALEARFADEDGDGGAFVVDAWFQDDAGTRTEVLEQGHPCAMGMRVRFDADARDPVFGFALEDAHNRRALTVMSEWAECETGRYAQGDVVDVMVSFDNWFAPGPYTLTAQVTAPGGERIYANVPRAAALAIRGPRTEAGLVDIPHRFHVVRRDRTAPPRSGAPS